MEPGETRQWGKRQASISVPPVAEVKILWTEPRSFFPRSQLKVFCIYCPLKNDHWPAFSPSATGESDAESGDCCYSPPDGIASKHPRAGQPHAHEISNQVQIHEVCLVWMEIVYWSVHRIPREGWKISPSRQVLRKRWMLERIIRNFLGFKWRQKKKKKILQGLLLLWVGWGKCVSPSSS